MAAEYKVEPAAYLKAVLHTCKHAGRPTLGALLGTVTESKDADVTHQVRVVDAVPLFHNVPLAPIMEVAMLQVMNPACVGLVASLP